MKRLSKFLSGLFFAMLFTCLFFGIEAEARISAPAKFYQTDATATSITLQWSKVTGADGYRIAYYDENADRKEINTTATSKKIINLSKNTKYMFLLYAYTKKENSDDYSYSYRTILGGAKTLPTITKVSASSVSEDKSVICLDWDTDYIADGYEVQLYDGNKKVKTYTTSRMNATVNMKIAANKFYKARIRAYIKLNGKKKWGKYCDWEYFSLPPQITSVKNTSSGIKLSWKKVSGATSYTVYDATGKITDRKKVGTTAKTSMVVNKFGSGKLKAGKTYYFYIRANKKVNSKTYATNDSLNSDISYIEYKN